MKTAILFSIILLFSVQAPALACLSIDPYSLDFGTVQTGAIRSKTVRVDNHCSGPVVVEGISVGPSDTCVSIFAANFGASRAGADSFRVEPGESALIKVDFSPEAEGNYNCVLEFSSNATGHVGIGLHGRASPAARITQYNFSLLQHGEVVFECGPGHCETHVGFVAVPDNVNSGFENPTGCPDEGFLQAVKSMTISFDPCTVDVSNFMRLPPEFHDTAARIDYKDQACPHSMTPACLMKAEIDPASVVWSEPSVCKATGVVKITIDGDQNVARCRNLPMEINTANGTRIVQSNNSATLTTAFNPYAGEAYHLFAEDNVITLKVPASINATVSAPEGLRAYEVFIKVTGADPQARTATVEAFVKDAQNNLADSFPHNVHVLSASWSGGASPSGGSSFQAVRTATVQLPESGEKVVRLTVTADTLIDKDGDGNPDQTVHVVWRSNELRFYSPAGCSGATICAERPPVLRPKGAPDRPIFTGLLNNMPDYNNYTGVAAPGALAPSLSYVDEGYWLGGAAKEGEWQDWVEDPEKGRVGYRFYTFKNATPWDVYAMCPHSEYKLPAGNAVLPGQHATDRFFNACVDDKSLDCSLYRTDASKNAWDLAWTTDGWFCVKYFCSEVLRAITMDDGGAECD